ncbi:MAG: AraC family transcriptional regulator [Burkholderiales bacterium]|nr:AraC family transcriptional regulator [Burkholderiales bacterium]
MIRFGAMSIILLLGALYGVLVAAMLWWSARNRLANRFLALLILVIVARLLPYIIGYAGYYDAYPWLSFAPWNVSLAFGPLLFLYVWCLTRPLPARWGWHFLPVAIQFVYYCVMFMQPLAFKNDWDTHWQRPIIGPIQTVATFASLGVYWWLSLTHYRAWQRWLEAHVSDREDQHLEWVRNFLIALGATLAVWMAWEAFEAFVVRLDYFQRFPLYVWLAVLVYYLGTEGLRHARREYSQWLPEPAAANDSVLPTPWPGASDRDWRALGERWRDELQREGWWRDPTLSLGKLARKLGTNTSHLSRAINEGLGQNFNEMVNRQRVAAVRAVLDAGGSEAESDLLDIALAAGFSSKASFNRSFKAYAGVTPSEYREGARRKS